MEREKTMNKTALIATGLALALFALSCGGDNAEEESADAGNKLADTSEESNEGLCAKFHLKAGEVVAPAGIKLFFTMKTCGGAPITNLEQKSVYIKENGEFLSSCETNLSLFKAPSSVTENILLLVDVSGSVSGSDKFNELVKSAEAFAKNIPQNSALALYAFDGAPDILKICDFSSDKEAIADCAKKLSEAKPRDPSTNLNGAIIAALSKLDERFGEGASNLFEKSGVLALFTDGGTDHAARATAEAAVKRATSTKHLFVSIALGEQINDSFLEAVSDAIYAANNSASLQSAFVSAAQGLKKVAESFYMTGYCTPKRSGEHYAALRVDDYSGELGVRFIAEGFSSGCSAALFDVGSGGSEDDYTPPEEACVHPKVEAEGQGDWRLIPDGCFYMGAKEVRAQVKFTNPLMVLSRESSVADWKGVVSGSSIKEYKECYSETQDNCPLNSLNWYEAVYFANALSGLQGLEACYELKGCEGKVGEDYRCEAVSWPKGVECEGFRLPTEAEWEYFAKSGSPLFSGETRQNSECYKEPELEAAGWYCHNSSTPMPVKRKNPNGWGLLDVHGNVAEWVWDYYGELKGGQSVDPIGASGGDKRIVKGGGYLSTPEQCAVTYRDSYAPETRSSNIGFRLVKTAKP